MKYFVTFQEHYCGPEVLIRRSCERHICIYNLFLNYNYSEVGNVLMQILQLKPMLMI